ncbi:MAG: pantoate--beta-alanine ligase [Flavobacteriaceae bacterium]|nr:pantoate--beta-alanine ligase [Flavobacteriaceae bacterium]
MICVSLTEEIENQLKKSRKKNKTMGLVPTMGSLHSGHLSLIEQAYEKNDVVWVSIFVNPIQFNNSNDLKNYPRNLKNDISKIQHLSDKVRVFNPSVKEMYKDGLSTNYYDFEPLDTIMEGEFRKNHFNGVATIVYKLLKLFNPNDVYFGEKDFQQVLIIKKLIIIEKFELNLIVSKTVREENGLAYSSRNNRLTNSDRKKASIIYKSLIFIKSNFKKKPLNVLRSHVISSIEKIKNFKVQYLEILDNNSLSPYNNENDSSIQRAFICVVVNDIRLIDNILLN